MTLIWERIRTDVEAPEVSGNTDGGRSDLSGLDVKDPVQNRGTGRETKPEGADRDALPRWETVRISTRTERVTPTNASSHPTHTVDRALPYHRTDREYTISSNPSPPLPNLRSGVDEKKTGGDRPSGPSTSGPGWGRKSGSRLGRRVPRLVRHPRTAEETHTPLKTK